MDSTYIHSLVQRCITRARSRVRGSPLEILGEDTSRIISEKSEPRVEISKMNVLTNSEFSFSRISNAYILRQT